MRSQWRHRWALGGRIYFYTREDLAAARYQNKKRLSATTSTKCLAYPAAAFKLINVANCSRDWVRRWLQSRRKTIRPAAVEICYVIAENCVKSETFVREWRYLGFLCCFAYQSKSGFTWNSCWKLSRAINFLLNIRIDKRSVSNQATWCTYLAGI